MGTAVQIQKLEGVILRAGDTHAGCQIEDMQQERAQLTTDKSYTVNWWDFRVLICLWSYGF